jgi:hypothetical protein
VLVNAGGGMTTERARGYWKSPLGGVTSEDVDVLEAYMEKRLPTPTILAIRDLVIRGLQQESFAIIVEDEMFVFNSN